VYLIEREDLYDRPNLYGNAVGDYYDNLERFTFFAHASLRLTELIAFQPGVIHCHDWQTGLVPALIKGPFQDSVCFQQTATVFTIHNLGYQGLFPEEKLTVTGLAKKVTFTRRVGILGKDEPAQGGNRLFRGNHYREPNLCQ